MAIFLFDYDGTLYRPKSGIPDSALQALKILKRDGHKIVLSTGRPLSLVRRPMEELAFDALIGGAGSYVRSGDTVLYDERLSRPYIEKLFRIARENGMIFVGEGEDAVYADALREDEAHQRYMGYLLRESEGQLVFYREGDSFRINKAILLHYGKGDVLERLLPELTEEADVISHSPDTYSEILPKGISKAHGMEVLFRTEEYASRIRRGEKVYAFGDSTNDMEMLEAADTGIAMGNAALHLKKIADRVAPCMREDGIRRELASLGFLREEAVCSTEE